MIYKKLNMEGKENLIEQVMKRYHFLEQDRASLSGIYQALWPLVQAEAYYIWNPVLKLEKKTDRALVFLSLGNYVDEFQNLYMESGCLREAYMVECISLEVLTEAYEEFVKQMQKDTHQWAKQLEFVGDHGSIEELPSLYKQVFAEPGPITYSEQCVLSPKKSVVFFLIMSDEKMAGNPCHICAQCKNTECIFRQTAEMTEEVMERNGTQARAKALVRVYGKHNPDPHYSYGYQRFFGSGRKEQGFEKETDRV